MADILTPDLCIIGAGPGGLSAAAAARALGASVVLVERGRLGGTAPYSGALPTQALLAAAARAEAVRTAAEFGLAAAPAQVNHRRLHDLLHRTMAAAAPVASAEHLAASGVQLLQAEGKFVDPRTLQAGETQVRAGRFLIATGARPMVPAVPGLNTVAYFTTETIFDNTRQLPHLVIVGAGAVGIALAQAYHRLGSHVTVVEAGAPLDRFDPELAEVALRRLRDAGVDIRGGTTIALVKSRGDGLAVGLETGGESETLAATHILLATPGAPELAALDLDKAGIRLARNDTTRLDLDARLRTSNRRVYAIGDASGTASWPDAQSAARRVVRHALLGAAAGREADAELQPRVAFSDPEIAEVGLSEPAAKAQLGSSYRVVRASYAGNDRAVATHQAFGVAKLVLGRDGRVLGAGIVGPAAAELISPLAYAVNRRLPVSELARFPAAYPSFAGLLADLAAAALGDAPPSPLVQRLLRLNRMLP